ncbi:group II intron maturase-specific domain-containing protein, partial [Vagococcus lutrae]|uniref:group II intron maturase-specific domain-containing protein n=1 Tax=Vagococcus lutrae TaxID=81947 RepID=UPI00280A7FA6
MRIPELSEEKREGKVKSRPTASAKQKFKRTLKRLTNRKRVGTLDEMIKTINQYTQGWIQYYKDGELKTFLAKQMEYLR